MASSKYCTTCIIKVSLNPGKLLLNDFELFLHTPHNLRSHLNIRALIDCIGRPVTMAPHCAKHSLSHDFTFSHIRPGEWAMSISLSLINYLCSLAEMTRTVCEKMSVRSFVRTSTIKLNVATSQYVILVEVNTTFTRYTFQYHPRSRWRSQASKGCENDRF